MSVIADPWLTGADTQAVFDLLEDGEHMVFAVGGCVRDALLGRPVADVDMTTDAKPARVMALAEAAGMKAIPTGIDHGTVTLISGGQSYEVTTLRRDLETDGRHARVGFGASVAEDARRRDFTMNALYADRRGAVTDPIGGLPDLRAGRVRFVGDPARRVVEDFLRILRFFRFTAHYGDPAMGIDADGLAACAAGAEGLDAVSRERIGAEMLRLLAAPDPAPAVASMQAAGVLMRVLPGADSAALAVLVHHEATLGVAPDPLRRLALLGGEEPGAALRLSRAEARKLNDLQKLSGSATGYGEVAWRHDAATARDAALLRGALLGAPLPENLDVQIATGATAVFPVSPGDLMPGFDGPALGAELRRLEALWIDSGFALDKAALLRRG